jgi:hypothetical protein
LEFDPPYLAYFIKERDHTHGILLNLPRPELERD